MHRLWHVFVLMVTLLGVASGALLVLVSLGSQKGEDGEPSGFRPLVPWLKGACGAAVLLLVVEWVGIH